MTRRALIIGYPGVPGDEKYCDGVDIDLKEYRSFLMSPIGGLWDAGEIKEMHTPSLPNVRMEIAKLNHYSYSMVIFCGHGYYCVRRRSTVAEINQHDEIDSVEMGRGSTKRTVILDCCRKVHGGPLAKVLRESVIAKAGGLNPLRCREVYDGRIATSPSSLVVMFACDINETAGDDSRQGGLYSYNLLEEAKGWAASKGPVIVQPEVLSVVGAHNLADPKVVSASGGTQHPQIQKPRSAPYFPFCVVA